MQDRIFSGEDSNILWTEINNVKDECANEALYIMGCYCQNLESLVRSLQTRIQILEDSNERFRRTYYRKWRM